LGADSPSLAISALPPAGLSDAGGFWRAMVRWLRANRSAVLTSGLVGSVLGYAVAYVMTQSFFGGRAENW
jgi:hypothetical protein